MAADRIESLLIEAKRDLAEGLYPARMFSDPDIFALERERIFGRAWVFLGHESEIPNPGDYVLRYIVDDQFIVTRAKDGAVRALHNSCPHRGVPVCRGDKGNAHRFSCPYHGWTFANTGDLVGVPMGADLYPEGFDKKAWGLRQLPNIDTFCGLIFGSMDPNALPLDEYLGAAKWYLQLLAGRTKRGLQVVGAPHRWVVDSNWKLPADNFVGDAYHVQMTHRSMLRGREPLFTLKGQHIQAGNGHGFGIGLPDDPDVPPYVGLPQALWADIEATLSPEQSSILKRTIFIHGSVFPNLSVLQSIEAKDGQSPPTSMLTFRSWQPIAANKMEIWSWCMVDSDAPPEYKKESAAAYVNTFGSGGQLEQDDAENWRSSTRAVTGQFSQKTKFNYQLSREKLEKSIDWPGPGDAYPQAFAEFNQIAFHKRWLAYMTGEI